MNVIIKPSKISGTVKAIASKSHAHRLLICSALSDTPTKINCSESSADIDATCSCLNNLGAKIRKTEDGFTVNPIDFNNIKTNEVLDCGESGSTLRFLLPITCALESNASFLASGRLPQRPIYPLYEELVLHGCSLSKQHTNPLICSGKLQSGEYVLPADISSQFISGLLFALPLLEGDSTITLTGQIESKPYIDMTLLALKNFGVDIQFDCNRIFIKGNQKYYSPKVVSVEGDWSNAAFWLCAGAISDTVTCTNLNINSLQGDKAITELLSRFGAKVEYNIDSVTATGKALSGIEINAQDIPDLVPALAAVASVAKGKTVITNAGRLRQKESDRLHSITETLKLLGADITEMSDGLVITGKPKLRGGNVNSFNDHRIVMMAAITSAICENPVVIENAQAVNKSYPRFFEDLAFIGGKINKSNMEVL